MPHHSPCYSPVLIVPLWNWNAHQVRTARPGSRSNRTFMELKHRMGSMQYLVFMVLIVPLWNWNRACSVSNFSMFCSSNRTFMELKLRFITLYILCLYVLIVPLWNWNLAEECRLTRGKSVLIVPLWNWNAAAAGAAAGAPGSNRTFMELKPREVVLKRLRRSVLIVPLWNWNRRLWHRRAGWPLSF